MQKPQLLWVDIFCCHTTRLNASKPKADAHHTYIYIRFQNTPEIARDRIYILRSEIIIYDVLHGLMLVDQSTQTIRHKLPVRQMINIKPMERFTRFLSLHIYIRLQ